MRRASALAGGPSRWRSVAGANKERRESRGERAGPPRLLSVTDAEKAAANAPGHHSGARSETVAGAEEAAASAPGLRAVGPWRRRSVAGPEKQRRESRGERAGPQRSPSVADAKKAAAFAPCHRSGTRSETVAGAEEAAASAPGLRAGARSPALLSYRY